MNELIGKWVGMITSLQGDLTILLVAVAGLSIFALVLTIIVTYNDAKRLEKIKSVVMILVFSSVAGVGGALVSWAIG